MLAVAGFWSGKNGLTHTIHVSGPTIFPQIAIAIGVLTSNRGGGRRTTLADWTWPVQGAVDVVPLLGAIVGCHCWVPV